MRDPRINLIAIYIDGEERLRLQEEAKGDFVVAAGRLA